MQNVGKLAGYTLFITGGSRGIGKEIAKKASKDGANVVIVAKTAKSHPKLPGTIYTAAEEIEEAGGKCLPCVVDVRDESSVKNAVYEAVKKFGGIDILVNNASAIKLTGTMETPMKTFDLMSQINVRGTYLCSRVCLPHLMESKKQGKDPHILNLSPPLTFNPIWFKDFPAYSIAKYGMSLCVLGMAEEFKPHGIAVNALWPRICVHTSAMDQFGPEAADMCRTPQIMSDAAYAILTRNAEQSTGRYFVDEEILRDEEGIDIDQYQIKPGMVLMPDFFVDTTEEAFENRTFMELYYEVKAKNKELSQKSAKSTV